MAVAFDAVSESDTGTTGATATYNWSHGGGTPAGALLLIFNNADALPYGAVTYGGVAMTAVPGSDAHDTANETGTVVAYFLGESVPTGTQTVEVTESGTMTASYAVCYTVTAGANTEVTGVVLEQENQAITETNVDDGSPGTNSLRFCGIIWGGSAVPGIGANSTGNTGSSIDFGLRCSAACRETTPGQGSRPVGFDSSGGSDDLAAVYLAVREVVAGLTTEYVAPVLQHGAAGSVMIGRRYV
jgi:hypothetical protein